MTLGHVGSTPHYVAPGTRGHCHGQHTGHLQDLHTWPVDQNFPWRMQKGGLPVPPAVEGVSL